MYLLIFAKILWVENQYFTPYTVKTWFLRVQKANNILKYKNFKKSKNFKPYEEFRIARRPWKIKFSYAAERSEPQSGEASFRGVYK